MINNSSETKMRSALWRRHKTCHFQKNIFGPKNGKIKNRLIFKIAKKTSVILNNTDILLIFIGNKGTLQK